MVHLASLGAALLGLLSATGAVAAPSSLNGTRNGTDCSAISTSKGFAWTVSDFSYDKSLVFSTPAHVIAQGSVSFRLANPALPDSPALCSATSSRAYDFFYGDLTFNCTVAPANGTANGTAPVLTSFTFSSAPVVTVKQAWSCPDTGYRHRALFAASGLQNLSLTCEEDNYVNPSWRLGQIYSRNLTFCKTKPFLLKPTRLAPLAA